MLGGPARCAAPRDEARRCCRGKRGKRGARGCPPKLKVPTYLLWQQFASGTSGGAPTFVGDAGLFNKRALNAAAAAPPTSAPDVTLTGDGGFTLQPGTYAVHWSAPASETFRHMSALCLNATPQTAVKIGSTALVENLQQITHSVGQHTVRVAEPTTYCISHAVQGPLGPDPASEAFGIGWALPGQPNVYVEVKVQRLA